MSANILSFPSKRERMLRTAERPTPAPRVTINHQRVQQLAERIERVLDANPNLARRWGVPISKGTI